MASQGIGNHTIYTTQSTQFADISPLSSDRSIGNGSLLMHVNNSTGTHFNVVRTIAPNGFTSGLGYCTIRYISSSTTFIDTVGYYFCASQVDLTAGAGTVWGVGIQISTSGTNLFGIFASTSGVSGLNNAIAQVGLTPALAPGGSLTLAVRWVYSTSLGGLWIRGYYAHGTALPNFDETATPAVEAVEVLAGVPTAVAEGEFFRAGINSNNDRRYSFDQVGRYPVRVGLAV